MDENSDFAPEDNAPPLNEGPDDASEVRSQSARSSVFAPLSGRSEILPWLLAGGMIVGLAVGLVVLLVVFAS